MKNSRYLILVFCGLLLFSCTGNKYIVERTPKHNNPVDEISWLKKRKKEFEKRECQITLYEKDGKTITPFLRLLPERSTKTQPSFTTKKVTFV